MCNQRLKETYQKKISFCELTNKWRSIKKQVHIIAIPSTSQKHVLKSRVVKQGSMCKQCVKENHEKKLSLEHWEIYGRLISINEK